MPTAAEDRQAIQDLFIRYAFALDGGDVEGVISCFAEDGSLESPVVGIRKGPAEVRAFAEQFAAFNRKGAQLRHILSNFAIDLNGDTARARCYLTNILTRDGQTILGPPGRYDCTMVRTPKGWLFQHRIVVLDGVFKLDGI